ncbi:L-cystine transport system permease protein YecS [Comamonadaceae bacterium OS-1]|nr:L-cystine transport system permease protein YecS [Comamonadaceae bacterium OS-1]
MIDYLQPIWDSAPLIAWGTAYTIGYALLGMVFGLPVALFITWARFEKVPVLAGLFSLYVSFMRGTPQLIQAFLIYFGIGSMGLDLPLVVIGTLVLIVNASAYLSETLRGALNGITHGQWSAGLSLGLTQFQTLRYVVTPQALRLAIPGISNTLIGLFKDTSVLSVITVAELLKIINDVISATFKPFTFYLLAAMIYWSLCLVYEYAVHRRLEARYSKAYAR